MPTSTAPATLSRTARERLARLLPAGIPRWIRCYDNGGISAPNGSGDRYTVCFTGRAAVERSPGHSPEYPYRAMSAHPFDPQGIGIWGSTKNRPCDVNASGFAPAIGRKCHLGKRIPFSLLPDDCRKLVLWDYREIWNLPTE